MQCHTAFDTSDGTQIFFSTSCISGYVQSTLLQYNFVLVMDQGMTPEELASLDESLFMTYLLTTKIKIS